MAKIPVVSIVGRPNVGKSCLLNRIVGRRVAVVDDQPGVTRDRNYQPASWDGRAFLAVDTGGLLPNSTESIPRHIAAQVDLAVKESSAIIFVVEAGVGPTELDLQVARILRRVAKDRLLLAVNKCEAESRQLDVHQYMALGCGEAHPISALHGLGIGDLLDKVAAKLDEHGASRGRDDQPSLRIAVVGRPNAGKSSLVNRLLGEERMIVDNVPGTTRDAIDSELRFHNRTISLIDTAGLRRKAQVKDDVEYYCNLRALESIKRCDVAVLLIDSSEALGEQDLKIVQQIHQHRRGLVVCWNKWDLAPKDSSTFDSVASQTRQLYPEMRHVPMLAISALTGQRVGKVVEAAVEVHDRMTRRIPHTELEDNAIGWARVYPHPVIQSKNVRLLGFKQRPASFPLFSCFVTNAKVALPMYNRFLENKMHDTYGFEGCPIIIEFRNVSRPTGRQAGKRAGK